MALRTEPSGKGDVLVINTGGTIAMVNSEPGNPLSPLRPADNWQEIEANFETLKPEYLLVDTDYCQFAELVDSSDVALSHWLEMAHGRSHYDFNFFPGMQVFPLMDVLNAVAKTRIEFFKMGIYGHGGGKDDGVTAGI